MRDLILLAGMFMAGYLVGSYVTWTIWKDGGK